MQNGRIKEFLGDSEVEPADDGAVEDHLLLIVDHVVGVHGAIDVVVEQVLVKHQGETPLLRGVGHSGLTKNHQNMLVDV